MTVPLFRTTADTGALVNSAVTSLRPIFRPDDRYATAGVMLVELQLQAQQQGELDLRGPDHTARGKPRDRGRLMVAVDAGNLPELSFSAIFNLAVAHQSGKAKHGGVLATASDLNFELVAPGGNAVTCIHYPCKPMAPAGVQVQLTALDGAPRSRRPRHSRCDSRSIG